MLQLDLGGARARVGFHEAASHELVDVERCPHLSEPMARAGRESRMGLMLTCFATGWALVSQREAVRSGMEKTHGTQGTSRQSICGVAADSCSR